MRAKTITFVIAALAASVASGQSLERVLRVAHAETEQDLQAIATVIRSITDIGQLSVDTAQRTLALHGTAGQIALAEWLFNELDRGANQQAIAQQSQSPPTHEYRVSGDGEDVVRVFYLANTGTAKDLQEVATVVRSTADIRRLFVYHVPRAMALRGQASQIALAEWLLNQLDKPVNRQARHEYRPSGGDDVVRVFYLAHADTAQDLQGVATVVRSMADIRQLFTYTAPRVLAVRGTAGQIAFAEWLINELDNPANRQVLAQRNPATHEYRMPGSGDDVVRVFYLANAGTAQDLQEVAIVVRSIADIRRLFTYSAPRAIAVRGTAVQIELAEWLIKEMDTPANRAIAQQSPSSATHEYRLPGGGDDVVRVFYLTEIETPQRLQEIAVQVRTKTEVRRLFIYNAPRAMTLRGTAAQIALADRLVKEHK